MHKPESVMEECKRRRKQKQFPYSFIPRDRKETIQEGRPNTSERPRGPPSPPDRPPPKKAEVPLPGPEGSRRGTPEKGAATYSPALRRSTIGAGGLNFSVRDGKRWGTTAIAKTGGREASGN